jgi:hypothetical protein
MDQPDHKAGNKDKTGKKAQPLGSGGAAGAIDKAADDAGGTHDATVDQQVKCCGAADDQAANKAIKPVDLHFPVPVPFAPDLYSVRPRWFKGPVRRLTCINVGTGAALYP